MAIALPSVIVFFLICMAARDFVSISLEWEGGWSQYKRQRSKRGILTLLSFFATRRRMMPNFEPENS